MSFVTFQDWSTFSTYIFTFRPQERLLSIYVRESKSKLLNENIKISVKFNFVDLLISFKSFFISRKRLRTGKDSKKQDVPFSSQSEIGLSYRVTSWRILMNQNSSL